ncbi:MAG: hypothetical protein M9962_05795 [Oligoflexia bacterium]|nr:hypothetical protein [Oligoflexia bacterium]
MKYFLLINEDQYFGPSMLEKFLENAEKPPLYVAILSRFSPNTSVLSRLEYLLIMLSTLPLGFLLKYSLCPLRPSWKKLEDVLNQYSIPFDSFDSANDAQLVEKISYLEASFGFSIASQIYTKETLKKMNCSLYNFHGGGLPENRGKYPFFWTAALSLQPEICVHQIGEQIDRGKILLRKELSKSANQSAAKVTIAYAEALPGLMLDCLKTLKNENRDECVESGFAPYRATPRWKDIFAYWFRKK